MDWKDWTRPFVSFDSQSDATDSVDDNNGFFFSVYRQYNINIVVRGGKISLAFAHSPPPFLLFFFLANPLHSKIGPRLQNTNTPESGDELLSGPYIKVGMV